MLFPTGIIQFLLGGILLGLSVTILYFLTGYILGASTSINAFLSLITKSVPSSFRTQRLAFFAGIALGAFLIALKTGFITTAVQPWRLFVGGIFAGAGATLARGCTSGHGICGLGSRAKSSFIYVTIFIIIAIITANAVRLAGVTP